MNMKKNTGGCHAEGEGGTFMPLLCGNASSVGCGFLPKPREPEVNSGLRAAGCSALLAGLVFAGCATTNPPPPAHGVSVPAAYGQPVSIEAEALSARWWQGFGSTELAELIADRKSTRLNSSHT